MQASPARITPASALFRSRDCRLRPLRSFCGPRRAALIFACRACPERFAGPVDPEDPVGFGCYFRTVRDIDPRHRELLQIAVDLRFLVEVQVSRAFVEEKNLRLAVKGARQQQALLLSAGQRAAHVADQAVIGHRHRHDLVVDAGHSGALDHPLLIAGRLIEADIIGDRTGQELVFLHDGADLLAGIPADRCWASGNPSINTSPLVGCSSPSMILTRVVLPPPDGPMIVTVLPGSIRRLMSSRMNGSVSA